MSVKIMALKSAVSFLLLGIVALADEYDYDLDLDSPIVFEDQMLERGLYHRGGKICETECISLPSCSILYGSIMKARIVRMEDIFFNYIQDTYRCGFKGDIPQVCCPKQLENLPTKLSKAFSSMDDIGPRMKIQEKSSLQSKSALQSNIQCGRAELSQSPLTGNATGIGDFPWLALLEYQMRDGKKFLCGGSLISDRHVLTSASCVKATPIYKLVSVRLGEHNTDQTIECERKAASRHYVCGKHAVDIGVANVHVHEGYDGNKNDIAVVVLSQKVPISDYIQPICLPDLMEPAKPVPAMFLAAGWSRTVYVPENVGLERKTTAMLKNTGDACIKSGRYNRDDDEDRLCVGVFPDKKSMNHVCVSDAGGPLMVYERSINGVNKLTLYGVSWRSLSCDKEDFPYGLYTKIDKYLPWIIFVLQTK